jgi:putative salt-induced outer membrane protein YdiY
MHNLPEKKRMRTILLLLCACLVAVLAVPAKADTVTLKNGDHVTGTVTAADNKTVTVKTDFAGDVKINWSSVQEITASQTLFVMTSDKQTMSGTVSVSGADLVVHTKSNGDVHVALAKLTIIRSGDAQAAYEKTLHPPFTSEWKGGVNAGFALARGNSQTTNLNFGGNANRKTLNDQITITSSIVYSKNDAPVGGGVTANEILGEARYDKNVLDDSLFWFVDGNFTHNALQGLNLQGIYTAGFGWHLIHTPKTTFDVLGGINYTRASYSPVPGSTTTVNVNQNVAGGTIGENFKHQFGAATTITEDFNFYPNITDSGPYRYAFDAAVNSKINKWLGWQVSFSDRYVSDPPIEGTKSNDVVFSTGLTATFGAQ